MHWTISPGFPWGWLPELPSSNTWSYRSLAQAKACFHPTYLVCARASDEELIRPDDARQGFTPLLKADANLLSDTPDNKWKGIWINISIIIGTEQTTNGFYIKKVEFTEDILKNIKCLLCDATTDQHPKFNASLIKPRLMTLSVHLMPCAHRLWFVVFCFTLVPVDFTYIFYHVLYLCAKSSAATRKSIGKSMKRNSWKTDEITRKLWIYFIYSMHQ